MIGRKRILFGGDREPGQVPLDLLQNLAVRDEARLLSQGSEIEGKEQEDEEDLDQDDPDDEFDDEDDDLDEW